MMYSRQTNGILINITPEYLDNRSLPLDHIYVWEYHIHIKNNGSMTLRLLSRHWKIVDSNGYVKEVVGPGVVGMQPILGPGEEFSYTSETSLKTPSGMMFGTYEMVNNTGKIMEIEIPAFSLDCPYVQQSVN